MALPIRTRPSLLLSQSLPSGSFHKPLVLLRGRQPENHNPRKLTKLLTWTTALSNSMKLLAMLWRATQDGQVIVESPNKMWSPGERNDKPLQYSYLENTMDSMKRQNEWILKEELPMSVGAQNATGAQWRKNEGMEPKQKQHPFVDVTGWWKQGPML